MCGQRNTDSPLQHGGAARDNAPTLALLAGSRCAKRDWYVFNYQHPESAVLVPQMLQTPDETVQTVRYIAAFGKLDNTAFDKHAFFDDCVAGHAAAARRRVNAQDVNAADDLSDTNFRVFSVGQS